MPEDVVNQGDLATRMATGLNSFAAQAMSLVNGDEKKSGGGGGMGGEREDWRNQYGE